MTGTEVALTGSYDYRLVALSVLIAVMASYAALDLLRMLRCDYAQGYYFSKPVTADEAGALLEKHPQW
jgi:EAL domain-containing protein (putative c-di-GMP-specific phosphodiesterase class I)